MAKPADVLKLLEELVARDAPAGRTKSDTLRDIMALGARLRDEANTHQESNHG